MITYFRQINTGVSWLDGRKALLVVLEHFLPITNELKRLQGVYLYYDDNDSV